MARKRHRCVCNTHVSGQASARQRTLHRNRAPDSRHAPRSGSGFLGRVFDDLASKRSADLGPVGVAELEALGSLGVRFGDGRAWLDADVELLSEPVVRGALAPETAAWLRTLELRPHIGSTNTTLLNRASQGRIDGAVLAAEVQTSGRGRRGRVWLSPFGRNLAVSMGVGIERPVAELGALSLVIGVAVRRALVQHGLAGIDLKWPNDVLLDGRKVAGILIELVRAVRPVEVVIGIGVNVGCADTVAGRVDQAIADVAEQVDRPSRNELLGRLLDHVAAACRGFDQAGFAPFRDEWDAAHRYRGRRVEVTVADGTRNVAQSAPCMGTVQDIGLDGSLRIATAAGVREFTGGEVTMRAATGSRPGPAAPEPHARC